MRWRGVVSGRDGEVWKVGWRGVVSGMEGCGKLDGRVW